MPVPVEVEEFLRFPWQKILKGQWAGGAALQGLSDKVVPRCSPEHSRNCLLLRQGFLIQAVVNLHLYQLPFYGLGCVVDPFRPPPFEDLSPLGLEPLRSAGLVSFM